jgi:hypothetical protein
MPREKQHQNSPNIVCHKQFIYEQNRIGEIDSNLFYHMGSFFFYAAKLNCASHCQNKPTATGVASPMISHGQTRYAC